MIEALRLESHSYQGQDLFVVDVLRGLRGGFFLDSGASDGIAGSNTWLLENSFGWTGICVEPNDAAYRQLVQNRRCTCVSCCLYDRDGSVRFLEAAGVFGGIVDEYDPALLRFAARVAGAGRSPEEPPTVEKETTTVGSLLRSFGAPRVIDYWSLDTEGSELAILRTFPFDEYRFRVLTVEHNGTRAREDIRTFLAERGYVRTRTLGIDDGYVWNGDLPKRYWPGLRWRPTPRARG